ncbi:MAG: hypothetical protein CR989_01390 [Flavobacteriales bacterium]|nr:MAG: hypothetical protein CR989_01390 [Flavobacteriales bacterium]
MKNILKIAIPIILLAGLFFGYKSQFTKIGLVNFRDAQMAEIFQSWSIIPLSTFRISAFYLQSKKRTLKKR